MQMHFYIFISSSIEPALNILLTLTQLLIYCFVLS